jgi:hypothetical protein
MPRDGSCCQESNIFRSRNFRHLVLNHNFLIYDFTGLFFFSCHGLILCIIGYTLSVILIRLSIRLESEQSKHSAHAGHGKLWTNIRPSSYIQTLDRAVQDLHTARHSLTHGAEPFLRSCQLCSYSRNSQHFMEPEGSLPCSREPSTGPDSEADQSSPYHPILSL